MESLDSRGLYIYDDGFRFVLWFGRMISPDIAMSLLGPDAAAELSKVCYFHNIYFELWNLAECYQGMKLVLLDKNERKAKTNLFSYKLNMISTAYALK